jgi:hypothetical protein
MKTTYSTIMPYSYNLRWLVVQVRVPVVLAENDAAWIGATFSYKRCLFHFFHRQKIGKYILGLQYLKPLSTLFTVFYSRKCLRWKNFNGNSLGWKLGKTTRSCKFGETMNIALVPDVVGNLQSVRWDSFLFCDHAVSFSETSTFFRG